MKALVNRLQIEVQSRLEMVDPKSSLVKGYDQKMKVMKETIMDLKHYVAANPFSDKDTEIKYFKHWLPLFYKEYIYYTALCQLECMRISSNYEDFSIYVTSERKRIAGFLDEHRDLYFYHMLGKTDEDDALFVRTPAHEAADFLVRDENFCQASLILSELLAYEDYKKILDKRMSVIQPSTNSISNKKLKWTGTKAEAVELIVLLYETKLISHEGAPATLEHLREWAEENMDVELKDFSVIEYKNRNRKITPTPLLDRMTRAYNARKDRFDP
ncbi:MAG: RteC domain-containing protein [Chitinophagaceae bacterium]|nr:RteC domain-containing protein [Chitinophagaceae bacterium]